MVQRESPANGSAVASGRAKRDEARRIIAAPSGLRLARYTHITRVNRITGSRGIGKTVMLSAA